MVSMLFFFRIKVLARTKLLMHIHPHDFGHEAVNRTAYCRKLLKHGSTVRPSLQSPFQRVALPTDPPQAGKRFFLSSGVWGILHVRPFTIGEYSILPRAWLWLCVVPHDHRMASAPACWF